MNDPLLTLDLVPKSSWMKNLRSVLPAGQWDILRKSQYEKAGHHCEICGASGLDQGHRNAVDCHEVWQYEEDTHTQRLVRLIALCPDCHAVKHFGFTQKLGPVATARAIRHLMRVNQWGQGQAEGHIKASFKEWKARSEQEWTLDISFIDPKA